MKSNVPSEVIELATELARHPDFEMIVERRKLELSFRLFVEKAWPLIEPTTPFIPGWYLDAICDHLQRVTETHEKLTAMNNDEIAEYRIQPGDIRYLLITMPPRMSKSTIVSVMWPAWEWTRDPSLRYLSSSYNKELAERDAIRSKQIIESAWYQRYWGHKVQMSDYQNKKDYYINTATGVRQCIGVGGGGTGFGGDRVMVDDPHNTKYAESDTVRQDTLYWWDNVMSTRLNDAKRDAMVVVQQRLHENDLAGHLIEQGGWVHLNLPMEFEGSPCVTPLPWTDPRTEEGEYLAPERFGPDEKRKKILELGSIGYAGQYQQRPVPMGGNIFQEDRWSWYEPQDLKGVHFKQVAAFMDTAYKEKEDNDYTVLGLWGRTETNDCYLLEMFRGRPAFPAMVELTKDHFTRWQAVWGCSLLVVEDKGSGTSLIQQLQLETGIPTYPYKVDKDKVARANSASGYQLSGKLFLPKRPVGNTDTAILIKEHSNFPKDAHDDTVDMMTMMLHYWIIAPPEKKKVKRKKTGRLRKSGYARHQLHRADSYVGRSRPRVTSKIA